ncbi:hypothetical protein Tco_0712903 [Tanacetum coccineum]
MGDFGNGYSEKDKNKGKTDKTKHGIGKSVKSRSRRHVHLKWANPEGKGRMALSFMDNISLFINNKLRSCRAGEMLESVVGGAQMGGVNSLDQGLAQPVVGWGEVRCGETDIQEKGKKKAKSKQFQARSEKGKVKSHQSKKIQLGGPKLPKPQVVLQKRKTRVKIAKKVEIAFKLYNLRGPFLPTPQKVFFPAPKNPVTTGMSSHTFYPAKPLFSIAKIISSTLLTHPSCIKAMLAIPHLSQVSSMAKIALQRSTNKIKGWDLLLIPLTQQAHLFLLSPKKHKLQVQEMKTSAIYKSLL